MPGVAKKDYWDDIVTPDMYPGIAIGVRTENPKHAPKFLKGRSGNHDGIPPACVTRQEAESIFAELNGI